MRRRNVAERGESDHQRRQRLRQLRIDDRGKMLLARSQTQVVDLGMKALLHLRDRASEVDIKTALPHGVYREAFGLQVAG